MAAAMWGYPGHPVATVLVKLFPDGSVNLNMGCSDIGCGTRTVMAMVVAEELGVPLDRIAIEHADTASTQFAPPSGGSQTVVVNAPAVRAAAAAVRSQLIALAARELETDPARLKLRDGGIATGEQPPRFIPLRDLEALRERQVLIGVGTRGPHPKDAIALPFAAHFVEVEVNTLTGEVRVLRVLAAHDSGRPMNALTYRNQVFGGITMALGFGLSERRVLDRQTGRMVNANWHDYGIPTALDVPAEPVCLAIDPEDATCNTVGAKGLGEPATIPTAAAVANAVYDAIGIRMTEAPITPMTLLRLLRQRTEDET
jgi:xanthine dehydrogenase YagR molybdenum-binding subunit